VTVIFLPGYGVGTFLEISKIERKMAKPKKKLTRAQREEKSRRRKLFMTVFIRGKQVRVRRAPAIDGVPVDEFIRQNADPIWLVQNEMYELIDEVAENQSSKRG
jgi:hypothetical protein